MLQAPGPIALRGARVVTVSGPVLEKGTVLLRNGLIEAVGENIDIPKDAWIVEAQGVTVYPGLIDALSTVGLPETAAQSAHAALGDQRAGETAIRRARSRAMPFEQGPEFRPFTTTWVRAADLLNPSDRRIEETRSAGFTSVVTFPSNGIFAGEGAFLNLSGEKQGRMVVASPAGQYVTLATHGFGTYPGSLMGVIAYIRQVSFDADHYKLALQAYTQPSRRPKAPQLRSRGRRIAGIAAAAAAGGGCQADGSHAALRRGVEAPGGIIRRPRSISDCGPCGAVGRSVADQPEVARKTQRCGSGSGGKLAHAGIARTRAVVAGGARKSRCALRVLFRRHGA